MTAFKKTKKPITTTLTFKVKIDPLWIPYLTHYPDIFSSQYCGYWMFGMEHEDKLGWLCFEHDDGKKYSRVSDVVEHYRRYDAVVKAWRAGEKLPRKWFRLDRDAAIKAWGEGVKRWGVDWYESVDANREDVVVQLALLGEIRYG